MKTKRTRSVWLVFYLLLILAAAMMLPRCGTGVGPAFPADAGGLKF